MAVKKPTVEATVKNSFAETRARKIAENRKPASLWGVAGRSIYPGIVPPEGDMPELVLQVEKDPPHIGQAHKGWRTSDLQVTPCRTGYGAV